MRDPRARADTRARRKRQARRCRDLFQRKGIEFRSDLALEPGLVPLPWMLARPAVIAQMLLGICFAALAPGLRARTRVLARGSLRCERLASSFDCSQAALTACLR